MASPLAHPIQFGKYTLFERIGRGGMADVYKGRIQGPAGFERVFVVKRILPHLSDDPTFNKMFVEEAKLSARLNHPNIVQVFELGSVEGEYFISMEYVRGRDLAETMRVLWARLGPPRPELVAYIGREMCRALAYAHNLTDDTGRPLGMIHRDVSPSNVMLSYEGAVKLLDFGIAKALGDAKEESNTRTGTLKGKFAYMAPEQTESSNVDKRIDIFAAGIVLHEVLTGRRLFKGQNDLQTIEKVRQCVVDAPSQHNPLCPPELDGVLLKALSRNRDDRFASAAEMADALDDVVHEARFQPDHLAQLMRELFPTDVGVSGDSRPPTGSGMVPSSLSSSSRSGGRPPSTSPSIPPVSRSVSPSRPPPIDIAQMALPRGKPLWKRPPVWAGAGGLLLLVIVLVAVGGGSKAPETPVAASAPKPSAAPTAHPQVEPVRPASGKVTIDLKSLPDGADVFREGEAKPFARTPATVLLDWDPQKVVNLILKKPGFETQTQPVVPTKDQPIIISLRPATEPVAISGPVVEPLAPSPKPEVRRDKRSGKRKTTSSGGAKKKRKNLKRGDLVNPF